MTDGSNPPKITRNARNGDESTSNPSFDAEQARRALKAVNDGLTRAEELAYSGHPREALDLLDELQPDMEADRGGSHLIGLASAYRLRGDVLEALGRPNEALQTWDALLDLEETLPESLGDSVAIGVQPRLHKAIILANRQRLDEASSLLDGALDKLETTSSSEGLRGKATLGVGLAKLQVLLQLDRLDEARGLTARVATLLGTLDRADAPTHISELELADALAAELHHTSAPDWWSSLAEDDPARLGRRASTLYRLCWPWLSPTGTAPEAAAFVLQEVGDSYQLAMLSANRSESDRARLDEPRTSHWYGLLTARGVPAWAAGLGHPIPNLEELARRQDTVNPVGLLDADIELLEEAVRKDAEMFMHLYGLLHIFLRSPAGRSALKQANLTSVGPYVPRLRAIVRGLAAVGRAEGSILVAGWCLIIARGIFGVASRLEDPDLSLLPAPSYLRVQLQAINGYSWLISRSASIPGWLADTAEPQKP